MGRNPAVFALLVLASSMACRKEAKSERSLEVTAASSSLDAAVRTRGLITFTKKLPNVNAQSREDSVMRTSLKITVDPTGTGRVQQPSTMETSERETKSEELLAVNGDAATKLKVVFAEKTERVQEGQKPETKRASPVAGKTYVVEAKEGKISVTDENGKSVSPVEAAILQKSYKYLGKPDPLSTLMPSHPIRVGDKVDELADALRQSIGKSAGDMAVGRVAVTLTDVHDDEGIFAVSMELSKAEGPMKFVIEQKGIMRVRRADSLLASVSLAGPVGVGINGADKGNAKMRVDGNGTMEIVTTKTYP